MVRIYVFINGQIGQATNNAAQTVWFQTNHPNLENIFVVDASSPENSDFIAQFQVSSYPTIVFVRLDGSNQGKTISRIQGAASASQIAEVLQSALAAGPGIDQNGNGAPAIIPGEDKTDGWGLGLLNLNLGNIILLAALGYYLLNKKR